MHTGADANAAIFECWQRFAGEEPVNDHRVIASSPPTSFDLLWIASGTNSSWPYMAITDGDDEVVTNVLSQAAMTAGLITSANRKIASGKAWAHALKVGNKK